MTDIKKIEEDGAAVAAGTSIGAGALGDGESSVAPMPLGTPKKKKVKATVMARAINNNLSESEIASLKEGASCVILTCSDTLLEIELR